MGFQGGTLVVEVSYEHLATVVRGARQGVRRQRKEDVEGLGREPRRNEGEPILANQWNGATVDAPAGRCHRVNHKLMLLR